ncbi:MAG: DUF6473 family protein [Rhodobacteraceae bacterium]|nr:DUF6473 family protein [Paracoccaceae bacterium]
MSYVTRGDGVLDYLPCRYGTSKLLFRGPRRKLEDSYVAVIGGTETYGRFVQQPYPALLEGLCGRRTVNFGYVNAGVDVFLQDETVMGLCAGAEVTIVQLLGAQNLTNRFYTVHPRRNDRLLSVSPLLGALYRDLDFAEFNFTRHLLAALQDRSPERFALVVAELKAAWTARMRQLLKRVGGRKILLWIGEEAPGDGTVLNARAPDPLFVSREMIETLRPLVSDVVVVVEDQDARAAGTAGMIFEPEDAAVAATTANAAVHRQVAEALAGVLGPAMP